MSVIASHDQDKRSTDEINTELSILKDDICFYKSKIRRRKNKLQELEDNFEVVRRLGFWSRAPLIFAMVETVTEKKQKERSQLNKPQEEISKMSLFSTLFDMLLN